MGIFDDQVDLWQRYRATLKFRDRVMGATPNNSNILQQWIRANAGVSTEDEIQRRIVSALAATGRPVDPDLSFEELMAASESIAGEDTNIFRRNTEGGLYLEGRIVKSMMREVINILYAGERWGLTNKGPKSYAAERVFVIEDVILLGRDAADGVETSFGHVNTPQGPRSMIQRNEFAFQPEVTLHVMVQKVIARTKAQAEADAKRKADGQEPREMLALDDDLWPYIWTAGQEIGLGAKRSQGHGRFDITAWDRVSREEAPVPGADAVRTVGSVFAAEPEPVIPSTDDDEKAAKNGAKPEEAVPATV